MGCFVCLRLVPSNGNRLTQFRSNNKFTPRIRLDGCDSSKHAGRRSQNKMSGLCRAALYPPPTRSSHLRPNEEVVTIASAQQALARLEMRPAQTQTGHYDRHHHPSSSTPTWPSRLPSFLAPLLPSVHPLSIVISASASGVPNVYLSLKHCNTVRYYASPSMYIYSTC
jgi:hypothetical protein